jgi:hypothetical protein
MPRGSSTPGPAPPRSHHVFSGSNGLARLRKPCSTRGMFKCSSQGFLQSTAHASIHEAPRQISVQPPSQSPTFRVPTAPTAMLPCTITARYPSMIRSKPLRKISSLVLRISILSLHIIRVSFCIIRRSRFYVSPKLLSQIYLATSSLDRFI